MKRIVMFDLDGTLLCINFEEFIKNYFELLIPYVSKRIKGDVRRYVIESTNFMIDKIDGRTNMEKFLFRFSQLSGLKEKEIYSIFKTFYKSQFPKLSFLGRPRKKGKEVVLKLREMGIKIVLATNSIFPLSAIKERMRWANLTPSLFVLITHMENMHAAKPHKEYYVEILKKLDAKPEEAVMVGDDVERDILPSKEVGIDSYQIDKDVKIDDILDLI